MGPSKNRGIRRQRERELKATEADSRRLSNALSSTDFLLHSAAISRDPRRCLSNQYKRRNARDAKSPFTQPRRSWSATTSTTGDASNAFDRKIPRMEQFAV